jgi:hypothetical protein
MQVISILFATNILIRKEYEFKFNLVLSLTYVFI